MKSLKCTPRHVFYVIIIMSIVGIFVPLLSYSVSAKNTETLIIILQTENNTVVDRTTHIVQGKMNMELPDSELRELIIKILYSENENKLRQRILSYIKQYNIDVTEAQLASFVEYMEEKREFYQDNYRSIDEYTDSYKRELNSIVSGTYMRLAGYPKEVLQEE